MSLIAGRRDGDPLKKPDRNGRDDDFPARKRANYSLTNIEHPYYTIRKELCQVLCPILGKNFRIGTNADPKRKTGRTMRALIYGAYG